MVEPNRAARLTEYLAYLALTEDTVTARSIDDAIWPNRKKENNATTRDPATSRLRKWLGTDEDGQLRLDVNTFELTGIDCDWYQFEAATRGPLTGVSTEQLAAAVRLVRGTPFKSAAVRNRYYSWAEPIQQAMISRIVDVCYELALRQLVDEEWLACEATLATGIDIEPGDEQLWRMRILLPTLATTGRQWRKPPVGCSRSSKASTARPNPKPLTSFAIWTKVQP